MANVEKSPWIPATWLCMGLGYEGGGWVGWPGGGGVMAWRGWGWGDGLVGVGWGCAGVCMGVG